MVTLGVVLLALAVPSASALLDQAFVNGREQQLLRAEYCFRQHVSTVKWIGNRKTAYTYDYEVVYLHGSPYKKLLMRNGVSLSRDEARREESTLQDEADTSLEPWVYSGGQFETTETVRSEMAAGTDLTGLSPEKTSAKSKLMREQEMVNGRKAWVITAGRPASLAQSGSKFARWRQTFWVDEKDHVIVQRRIEFVREGASGGKFVGNRVYAKEGDSVWLLRLQTGEFVGRGFGIKQEIRYSGYRKFDAQSELVPRGAPE